MTEAADSAHESFMRSSDAFSWYHEQDPALRATIVAVLWLDRAPDWDVLCERVEAATQVIGKLRQVVRETPAPLTPPRWLPDRAFDLLWHLRRTAAPGDRSPASVLALARAEAMTGFDRTRPLWQFTLVERLIGGRAAMIMKIHHALTDGIGAMRLAPALFDTHRAPVRATVHQPKPVPDPAPILPALLGHYTGLLTGAVTGGLRSAVPASVRLVTNPVGALTDVARTVGSIGKTVAPTREPLSPVMRARGLARDLTVLTIDLADLAGPARAVGATVNDAFLTAVTGGLRRYHQRHNARVAELRVTMPISIRTDADADASNRITLLRLPLPVSEPDTATRMALIHRACRRVKSARSLGFTDLIAGGLDLLPTSVTGSMLKQVDFLASDVTGLPETVYLAGAKVTTYAAFGPTMGSAANLTLLSYADLCHVGITTDHAAVPDPAVFLQCLRDGFAEVLALHGRHNGIRLIDHDAVPDLPPEDPPSGNGRPTKVPGRAQSRH